jgi:hypothetical protein
LSNWDHASLNCPPIKSLTRMWTTTKYSRQFFSALKICICSQKWATRPGWPDWANFGLLGIYFLWAFFWKFMKLPTNGLLFLLEKSYVHIYFAKNELGYILGDCFVNSSGHPDYKTLHTPNGHSFVQATLCSNMHSTFSYQCYSNHCRYLHFQVCCRQTCFHGTYRWFWTNLRELSVFRYCTKMIHRYKKTTLQPFRISAKPNAPKTIHFWDKYF